MGVFRASAPGLSEHEHTPRRIGLPAEAFLLEIRQSITVGVVSIARLGAGAACRRVARRELPRAGALDGALGLADAEADVAGEADVIWNQVAVLIDAVAALGGARVNGRVPIIAVTVVGDEPR